MKAFILFILLSAATILLLSEINEYYENWVLYLIGTKIAGLALGYATFRLYQRWSKTNAFLAKIDKMIQEDDEA